VETPVGIPPSLSQKMTAVKSYGGIGRLNEQIQHLKSNHEAAKNMIEVSSYALLPEFTFLYIYWHFGIDRQ